MMAKTCNEMSFASCAGNSASLFMWDMSAMVLICFNKHGVVRLSRVSCTGIWSTHGFPFGTPNCTTRSRGLIFQWVTLVTHTGEFNIMGVIGLVDRCDCMFFSPLSCTSRTTKHLSKRCISESTQSLVQQISPKPRHGLARQGLERQ